MNIRVHVSLQIYYRMLYNPLDIYPVMGLLGQMEFLFLRPWGITTLSSTMVELIYTPTSSVKYSCFSTSSPASVVFRFFNDRHSNWREMVSQFGFDLHLCNDQWWWEFFHMFVGFMYVFFCKVSVHILCPVLNEFVCFFSCKSVWVLCKFRISAPCQIGKLQKFFPILLVASSL